LALHGRGMPHRLHFEARCACVKHFGASECLIIKNLHLILVGSFFLGHISFYGHVCVTMYWAYGNCMLFIWVCVYVLVEC